MNRFATILVALLASVQAPAASCPTPPNAASAAIQAANAGVLSSLAVRRELAVAMALTGARSISEVHSGLIESDRC